MAARTLVSLSFVLSALAQGDYKSPEGFVPLAFKHFAYPDGIPQKVDTDVGNRGGQHGYNKCDASTEGPSSLCQTSFLNSIDDFCLWGPPDADSTIGDTEGEAVAWCMKPGHGTRVIPAGALTGLQFMRTPDYIQVVGTIDQTKINIQAGDFGGEMDPHGADLRGNPMGGILYSSGFPSGGIQQVIEWHNFMGSDTFCLKVCDPKGPNAAQFCEHRLDRIGCAYNAPSKGFEAIKGTFETCDGENQDYPGVYVEAGVTKTYEQPAESLGAISTMPYVARVPASSNCVAHNSAEIYAAGFSMAPLAPQSHAATSSAPVASATSVSASLPGSSKPASSIPSATAHVSGTPSRSGALSTARPTGTAALAAAQTTTSVSAASVIGISSALVAFALAAAVAL